MKKITVLTGAGMSAESGIKTFREAGGLWEEHDVMEVASIEGWHKNPELILQFYNERRAQLHTVNPNAGHLALTKLESNYQVTVVTQNIDDLHERAGSSNVVHLHGELLKAQSSIDPPVVVDWPGDLKMGDLCEMGSQLRPNVVWFGEAVPMIEKAAYEVQGADYLIIIGSSMQVYPAASLAAYASPNIPIFYIDPNPSINYELARLPLLDVRAKIATIGVPEVVSELLST